MGHPVPYHPLLHLQCRVGTTIPSYVDSSLVFVGEVSETIIAIVVAMWWGYWHVPLCPTYYAVYGGVIVSWYDHQCIASMTCSPLPIAHVPLPILIEGPLPPPPINPFFGLVNQ